MRISIRNKLTATYLFISIFTALLIYLLTYFTSEQRISALALEYQTTEMIIEAEDWYAASNSWAGFPAYFNTMHPNKRKRLNTVNNNIKSKQKIHSFIDKNRKSIFHYLTYQPGEIVPVAYLAKGTEILHQGEIVGWILPPDATRITLKSQVKVFLENIQEVMMIAVAISVICSLIIGVILAKIVLKPVASITKASIDIAQGELNQKVIRYSDDELGDLAIAFNKMSQDLVTSDQQRKQLTADITHDLATPVQVISGYIEMAQEGIVLNEERIEIIASELELINRLIKDMSLLAETDSKTLSLTLLPTQIKSVLQRAVKLYKKSCHDKQVQLTFTCESELPTLLLDEERIMQVLGNLMTNALRYTEKNDAISISAYQSLDKVIIKVADTGAGINALDLPYIFDRFYRSGDSRSHGSGKMGLGLAISKGLIEMHQGEISAYSKNKGACFKIIFPIAST